MGEDLEPVAAGLFEGMLARAHLARPSDVGTVVVEEVQRALGASEATVYWVNREQTTLVPLPSGSSPERDPQPVDSSAAGRAYMDSTMISEPVSAGRSRLFVPLIDGTDRLGILEVEVATGASSEVSADLMTLLERYGHAIAQLLMTKTAYGDSLHLVQRSRPMGLGAELLWSVLPPLTYATEGLVVTAILEPAYENGGDAFDYAVNGDVTHVAVLDGAGHGLAAAGLSTFAVATYRHSRRAGLDLVDTYAAMDAAVTAHFGEEHFVTAVLAELDTRTGRLRWLNAGHPPPIVLRDGQVSKVLRGAPATPLGLPMFDTVPTVHEETLQPGDSLVLYTDGVTEARRPDGTFLGLEGLMDFLSRDPTSTPSPPEVLRRLRRTLINDEGAVLHDDATVLLLDWQGGSERLLLPQTVPDPQ